MKKAFDQTVRDIKRGVNKKVLKVPGIEQKVLDATSNEAWGPHGSLLADIAQATRNYHEYQMIMTILWKRINDTGKNWRHVYKGLTVLEYLVANGSERVIDEIREHAYQISTLSDFQYIDSSGRDQGNNVRKKSQSLVALVNDKERIAEVRQKAAANRDKFRSASSGGMYRPGSYSSGGYGDRHDDDRYGSRDGDRNGYGYGREQEGGYRDDDRYGRYGDSYSRDGDRFGRDYEDRFGRESYRDDEYRGRSQTVDDYQSGTRSRSSEGYQGRSYDDDGQYSSRDSGAKADDVSQNGRGLEQKNSEQTTSAPPSYEEALNEARSPVYSGRNGEKVAAPAPRESSPTTSFSPTQASAAFSPIATDGSGGHGAVSINQDAKVYDEFDPRGPVSAASAPAPTPAAPITQSSSNAEVDLLGSLSDSFSLAIVPTSSAAATSEASMSAENFGKPSSASNNVNKPFEDPFGDGPFKAIPSSGTVAPPQTSTSAETFQPNMNENTQSNTPSVPKFGFGDSFSETTYSASGVPSTELPANSQSASQGSPNLQQEVDILADILPPAPSSVSSQSSFSGSTGQAAPAPFSALTGYQQPFSPLPGQPSEQAFSVPTGPSAPQTFSPSAGQYTEQPSPFAHTGQHAQASGGIYEAFNSQVGSLPTTGPQAQTGYNGQISGGNFLSQGSANVPSYVGNQPLAGHNTQSPGYILQQGQSTAQLPLHMTFQSRNEPPAQLNGGIFTPHQGIGSTVGSLVSQSVPSTLPLGRQNSDNVGSLFGQTGGDSLNVPQPSRDKFETKSTVWADTLSRGLVDLNISGPKTNPLSDIGIDFDAINRKERRMEKPSTTPVVSTVNMGKAMGAGSGIGRAGASAMRAPPSPMIGSGMGVGIGMGVGVNPAMSVSAYGGMNPSLGMGMGMAQGAPMQPPSGFPPGANMSGAYNPMMGRGGYGPLQPYGGYR